MRPLRDDERVRAAAALERFGPGFLAAWLRDRDAELWTRDGAPQTLHLVRRVLADLLRRAPDPAPQRAGLFVGELDGERVHLSLEGAYEVGRRSRTGRVVVSDKAVQLFLYGRDVLGESIERADPAARTGTVAIVTNRRGDVLGLAEVLQHLPGHGPSLRALADRGWYLREGG